MKEIDKLKKKHKILKIINIFLITSIIINFYLTTIFVTRNEIGFKITILILIALIITISIISKITKNLKTQIITMNTITKSIEDSRK